jgi:hypothetical protein
MSFFHGGILTQVYKDVAASFEPEHIKEFKRSHHGKAPWGSDLHEMRQPVIDRVNDAFGVLAQMAEAAYNGDSNKLAMQAVLGAGKTAPPDFSGNSFDRRIWHETVACTAKRIMEWK